MASYYEILGIPRTATSAEVRQAYARLARERHPDRFTDPAEKAAVLTALVEKIATGRSTETRPATAKELAQTAVLALPLVEVAAKVRNGPVADDDEDYSLPHWAGIVPLRLAFGEPQPDTGVGELPGYLRAAVMGVTA